MVCIDNDSRICKFLLVIQFAQMHQIFIVIIRHGVTLTIYIASQNCMGQRIACSLHFPTTIQEGMARMSCNQRIHHNRQVTASRVLHTNRNIQTTCSQSVLLVFYRTSTNGNIGQQVRQIPMIFRIQHFICTSQASHFYCLGVHLPNGNDTLQHIFFLFRVWLMHHALIAFSGGSRLVGVNSRNQNQLVLDLFLHLC